MDKSNLIVNYLPSTFAEADLLEMFERYGAIQSVKIVRDKSTGISMGFGFVNFDTNEAAEAAVNALNTTVLPEGKRMKVSVARPAWKANIHSNLYVSGIPLSYTEKDIEDLFGPEYKSHIEAMRLLYDQTEQQNFRGIAVVRFDTEESAYNAMKAFSNCQLTDPVSKITSSLQLKPWRPEFRADRVDSEVMREQLLVGQQTTSPGLQPVAGLRGSRAYSTGMFNVKSPLQPYTAKQQSETSRYAPRSRFASSSIGDGESSSLPSGGSGFYAGLSRAYRPQSESTTDKHSGNWESAWNEYLRNVIGSQGSKNGDKTGQPFGFASSPSPPQLLSTTVPDSSLMMQAAAAMDQRGIMGGGELPSYSGRGLASGEWTDSGALLSPPTPSTSSQAALFIFHLPPDCDDATLRMLFEQYGQIDSVKVVAGKGYGFVNFVDWENARRAVEALNGFELGKKRLKVEFKKPRADSALGPLGMRASPPPPPPPSRGSSDRQIEGVLMREDYDEGDSPGEKESQESAGEGTVPIAAVE